MKRVVLWLKIRVAQTPISTAGMLLLVATFGAVGFATWIAQDEGNLAFNAVMFGLLTLCASLWFARLVNACYSHFRSR